MTLTDPIDVETSPDYGDTLHSHRLTLPRGEDGTIPAGTYRTTTDDGHSHDFVLLKPQPPDEDSAIAGETSEAGAGPHFHRLIYPSPPDRADLLPDEPDPEDAAAQAKADARPTEKKCPCADGGYRHECCPKGSKAGAFGVETFAARGHVREVKQATRNGVPVGIVAGYIATWDPDTGGAFGVPDKFVRGAFADSLRQHRARGGRPVRLKDHHGRTIGGFPIETVREDEIGLYGVGEINLAIQQGAEAFALARQGILTDFSVGFITLADRLEPGGKLRVIERAELVEGSIVDEPANPAARILEVKAVVPFQDLPLADRERAWDSGAAIARVKALTGSEDGPSSSFRRAFLWYDSGAADQFGSYKLPIADVVNGRLTAVPRAIFAAAAALRGARGGVDLPAADRAGVIRHLERYYAKLDEESPFAEERSFWTAAQLEKMTPRELEAVLLKTGFFARSGVRFLVARREVSAPEPAAPAEACYDQEALADILRELEAVASAVAKS